jgi:hypothetical protein
MAQIRKVKQELAGHVALIPFQVEEPVGTDRLVALASINGGNPAWQSVRHVRIERLW